MISFLWFHFLHAIHSHCEHFHCTCLLNACVHAFACCTSRYVCVCAGITHQSLSDASLPWLKIKNTCTVSPQGPRQTAVDWQQQTHKERKKGTTKWELKRRRKNRCRDENTKGKQDACKRGWGKERKENNTDVLKKGWEIVKKGEKIKISVE